MDLGKPTSGSELKIIIDSSLSYDQAVSSILDKDPTCPKAILESQSLIDVVYYSFDGREHQGQLVLDKRLENDVQKVFELLRKVRFPIKQVKPVSEYGWDDFRSMEDDNSSGFNYRLKTNKPEISLHGLGQAIDLNPLQNPYIEGKLVAPPEAIYDPFKPGTILADSEIVYLFKELGWEWGGDWIDRKDYQHFQKSIN